MLGIVNEPAPASLLKKVFVISPINKLDENGVDFTAVCLQQIIKPAAERAGGYAVPVRADEHHSPGSITAKVVTAILDADVCVADLTTRNPNVMYEVAIAHAAGKPVILLQQEDGGPPFDFTDERVIQYGLRVDQANEALRQLVKHFQNAHGDQEDARLAATMNPVRMLFGRMKAQASATDPEKDILHRLDVLSAEVRDLRHFQRPVLRPDSELRPSVGALQRDLSMARLRKGLKTQFWEDPDSLRAALDVLLPRLGQKDRHEFILMMESAVEAAKADRRAEASAAIDDALQYLEARLEG